MYASPTTTTNGGVPRRQIDASLLKDSAMDARAPLWWGNLLMIFIETTTMVLLLAAYFYVRRNFWEWPPPRVDQGPPMLDPAPNWGVATINMVLMALTCPFMYWVDQRARELKSRTVGICLFVMLAVTLINIALRGREFHDVHFRWDDNAYASAVWGILFMHLLYLVAAAGEYFIMGLWALRHGLDEKHALDVTLAGGYQYWLVGIWIPCYVTVFWYPRWT